jgi:hypothetical protein
MATLLALSALPACAPRPVACTTACTATSACVAGECLPDGQQLRVGALDRFGQLQARRLVFEPVDVVFLHPGDTTSDHATGAPPRVARFARDDDGRAVLLLRFEVDLPPGTTVVDASLLLDRATSGLVDPVPVAVHAARIADPWDGRSIAWGRAPRIEEAGGPRTPVEPSRRTARIVVRSLVQRWRLHAPDDQGIALLADKTSPTGMPFALVDGAGSSDDAVPVPPVHAPGPPTLFASAQGPEAAGGDDDAAPPHGPRLELYVKP